MSLFDFNGKNSRVVTIDGQPWFVAADVITILYGSTNSFGSIYRLVLQDERSYVPRQRLGLKAGKPMVVLSESGLYRLIMRSIRPEALDFQNWVTRSVLPTLRKDGAYIRGEEELTSGEMGEDEFGLKAMNILQNKVERLAAKRDTARAVVDQHLMNMAVGDYCRNNGLYLDQFTLTKLAATAKWLCIDRGIELKRCGGDLSCRNS